ncbi:surface antigen protein [Trypanosoma grayi]|uniref:surface antigen protein n=1 Tax=Trypanosoma grayi TaxID=71804 RepID=UPI0004F47876|nr:surface antigen protein [Trypanosoma grayi]KEG06925.1 surface antigen protein [Trypanosoma grayi]
MAQHQHHVGAAVLVTLLLCVLTPSVQAQGDPTETKRFLDAFISSIPSLKGLWTGSDYCSYPGVTCDADGYARIDLSSVAGSDLFSGKLPNIRHLSGVGIQVREINMNGMKKITGPFQDTWARLVNLESLDLSNTGLGGMIPSSWNGMSSLKNVAISGTKACKGLPDWTASSMPQLVSVNFANNFMGGPLTTVFGTFSDRAMTLDISGNSFCGCLPSTWTSPALRNAAQLANPKLLDLSCKLINTCVSKSFACTGGDGAAALSTHSPLLALFASAAAALALMCA